MSKKLFTSESVMEGHPDKICDQISDAILDYILKGDSNAKVACETVVTTGLVLVMGEVSTNSTINVTQVVRDTIRDIGYTSHDFGFHHNDCSVIVNLNKQSVDISDGIKVPLECRNTPNCEKNIIGAGDQGIIFGYATNETKEFMPLPITIAHKLSKFIDKLRKEGVLDYLGPDGKTQVTVEYENGKPIRIDTIVISVQHKLNISQQKIREDLIRKVVNSIIPKELIDENTKIYVNPSGRFVIGGPQGDTGLTGRKIIVDTYGGVGRHGGGAFSGKDPTKVDRSASYAARWAAKNLVAAKIADKIELQISYAIGIAEPVSISVDTFGTSKFNEEEIVEIIKEVFHFSPSSIIDQLELREPIYKKTAVYGHFGRCDIDVPWERLNKVEEIKVSAKKIFKNNPS